MRINYWYNYETHSFEFDLPPAHAKQASLFVVLPRSVNFLDNKSAAFTRAQQMLEEHLGSLRKVYPGAEFNLVYEKPQAPESIPTQLDLL